MHLKPTCQSINEILGKFSRNTGIGFEPTPDETSYFFHATDLIWTGITIQDGQFLIGGKRYMTQNSRL